MFKVKLFSSKPTVWQQSVVGLWLAVLLVVLLIWSTTSTQLLTAGNSGFFTSLGRLFGLLATFFALTQFMLMGRIAWIERAFGLDHLASYHRLNGYLAISFILIHPVFITTGYALAQGNNLVSQYFDLILHYNYVWLALIAEILFITVVATSIYIARRRLKFESWYFVHLAVYFAIIIVSFHQFALGGSFQANSLTRDFWYGLYSFVGLNILIWRFGLPIFNWLRFSFIIDAVEAETPTTASVYIRGRGLERWRSRPGQFVMVRIFARDLWWQEHPFSLSMIPDSQRLRLTIRNVGDYTADIQQLKPGAGVLVSGPYGRFTSELARTNKRLFIAGGVGITPLRSLAEQAVMSGQDSAMVYGNKTVSDVPLKSELDNLVKRGLRLSYVYSETKVRGSEKGYVNGALIKKLVPDYKKRDIYLCGPPPMMEGIVKDLARLGFPEEQLHYERFALHNT